MNNSTPRFSKSAYLTCAALLTLVAIGLHIYLTNTHFDLKLGTAAGPSVCNINAAFNCDAVSTSKYAALFGIPLALWGAFANIFNLGLILIARFRISGNPARIERYSLYISVFIALVSIVMGAISTFKVSSLCLFCIGTYVLSFLTLACVYKSQSPKDNSKSKASFASDLSALFGESRSVLIAAVIFVPATFLANSMILDSKGGRNISTLVENSIAEWQYNPEQVFSADTGLRKSVPNPVMTIVEFADFRCSHCRAAAPTLTAFAESHPDVELVFKSFPLDGTCNPADAFKGNGDGQSCKLAFSVFCAEKKQKGWDAFHWIFNHQEETYGKSDVTDLLKTMSSELKLDWSEMETCIADDSIKKNVAAQATEGILAKVQGTPAIYVNGKKLNGAQILPVLRGAYDHIKGN